MEFKKLSLVYAEGFSDLNASSRGWGLVVGSGVADLGFGKFTTRGEIQSRLSQKLSPPRKWSYWKILVYGLIGLPVLDFILAITSNVLPFAGSVPRQLTCFGSLYLAAIAVILALVCWRNFGVYPKLYRLWDRSFMCRRCGHIMRLPLSSTPSSQAIVREARP